jgi:hypothetical protein
MTLAQIFDWCNKKSYYSRDDDEIWQAINSAAHLLYKEVVLENKGYFIVFDTTDLVFAAGTKEYQLPATCQQIVRLREQTPGETAWRVVSPAELNDPATTAAGFGFDTDVGAETSRFIYNGPYLKQSDAAANDEIYSIRIEPIPQETHNTELVFTADFIEIEGQNSTLVIDPEGHDALKYLATAELLLANDDDNAANFQSTGSYHKTQYLKLVRKRQIQQGPTIEPYIFDMD